MPCYMMRFLLPEKIFPPLLSLADDSVSVIDFIATIKMNHIANPNKGKRINFPRPLLFPSMRAMIPMPFTRTLATTSWLHSLAAITLLFFSGVALTIPAHAETTSYSGGTCLNSAGSGPQSITSSINVGSPGTYYLNRDIILSGAPAGTPAINVYYPGGVNVTIDLNGHSISTYAVGQSVNLANDYYGIGVYSCSNLTVRNGTISGFVFGLFSNDPSTSGHRIDNVRFTNNTCVGVYINGSGSVIRNCRFLNTGGSTYSGIADCHGVLIAGAGDMVIDCDVSQVTASGNNGGIASGITFSSTADGVALNNRISLSSVGLRFESSTTVKYRDNLFGASVATQVSGSGIDAGGNF